MILPNITESELEFMESWYTPLCLAESLFNDFDNPGRFDFEKFGEVRLYQTNMLSNEAIIDFEATGKYHKLNKSEIFKLRKNVADVYNFGARLYGKTAISLRLDMCLSALYDESQQVGFYSIDEKRLRNVLDNVKLAMEHHPIYRIWNFKCTYKPEIKFYGNKNYWSLKGINMTLGAKSPGCQFYSLHVEKLYGDEVSLESHEVYEKRNDAVSEIGSIERLAGMTNYTKTSPAGKTYYNPLNKQKIINYPQFVNPFWNEETKQDRIEKHGGEESFGFRIFCKGEVIEDGLSVMDMERVQACFQPKKKIKRFELKKNQFENFDKLIVVDRPKNADYITINADIGLSSGTNIIIHSKVGEIYNYLYDIVIYGFTRKEQLKVFQWLIDKLQAEVIGLDAGDGTGKDLAEDLEDIYGKEKIVKYAGASKIEIGFEKDEQGQVLLKNGEPVYRKEYMSEWSVRRLQVLLYEHKVNIPVDHKFFDQVSSIISTKRGERTVYACISKTGDHLWDAWKVFAISDWLKNGLEINQKPTLDWCGGISSWKTDKN